MSSQSIIHQGSVIGRGVAIGNYVVAYPGAIIEDNCIIEGFTQIWPGVTIHEGVRLGSNVIFERSNVKSLDAYADIEICKGAKIGAGAIIHQGISVGEGAVVTPGAVVAQNVPPYSVVEGTPARVVGYVECLYTKIENCPLQATLPPGETVKKIGVNDVTLHRLKLVSDPRGDLSVGEFLKDVPFKPKRFFFVFNVPNEKTRGEHAHHQCHQFLICVKGSCAVVVDDGKNRCEVSLDNPDVGIYLPPLTWGIQYKYSADAVLLVFASDYYNPQDYIRNYTEFDKLIKNRGKANE